MDRIPPIQNSQNSPEPIVAWCDLPMGILALVCASMFVCVWVYVCVRVFVCECECECECVCVRSLVFLVCVCVRACVSSFEELCVGV